MIVGTTIEYTHIEHSVYYSCSLPSNKFKDEGAKRLCDALSQNETLTSIQ